MARPRTLGQRLQQALEALFRAYVDDATGRRGCTDVVRPDAADFARN
ncbi:hypothetical protein [Streptomyces sp. NPDC088746]